MNFLGLFNVLCFTFSWFSVSSYYLICLFIFDWRFIIVYINLRDDLRLWILCVCVCVCVCVCIREDFLCFWQGGWEKIISVQLRIEVIPKLSLGPLENYIFQLTFYLEYSLSESQMEIWPLLGSPSAELKLQCLFFLPCGQPQALLRFSLLSIPATASTLAATFEKSA